MSCPLSTRQFVNTLVLLASTFPTIVSSPALPQIVVTPALPFVVPSAPLFQGMTQPKMNKPLEFSSDRATSYCFFQECKNYIEICSLQFSNKQKTSAIVNYALSCLDCLSCLFFSKMPWKLLVFKAGSFSKAVSKAVYNTSSYIYFATNSIYSKTVSRQSKAVTDWKTKMKFEQVILVSWIFFLGN